MTTPRTSTGAPIFGADVNLDTEVFAVPAIHRHTRVKEQFEFAALRDPGSGVILPLMKARDSDEANGRKIANLISRALADDDGLSENYKPPQATADNPNPEVDPRLEDREQWSSARRFYWLMDAEEYVTSTGLLGELADWLIHNAMTRGGTPIGGDAVPTPAPSPSGRGRTAKQRGSTAKRSGTA